MKYLGKYSTELTFNTQIESATYVNLQGKHAYTNGKKKYISIFPWAPKN